MSSWSGNWHKLSGGKPRNRNENNIYIHIQTLKPRCYYKKGQPIKQRKNIKWRLSDDSYLCHYDSLRTFAAFPSMFSEVLKTKFHIYCKLFWASYHHDLSWISFTEPSPPQVRKPWAITWMSVTAACTLYQSELSNWKCATISCRR